MRGSRPSRLQSDINVTPLIDVCLVLLIAFMVVTPILTNGPKVDLPKAHDPKKADPDANVFPIVLVFDDPPQVLFGPDFRWVQADDLKRSAEALHASEPGRRIVLRADRRLSYGAVKAVMRTLSEAGFQDLALAAEKEGRSAAR